MSASFWLSAMFSAFVLVWAFVTESLEPEFFPAVVSFWAVGVLLIGMIDLWVRKD